MRNLWFPDLYEIERSCFRVKNIEHLFQNLFLQTHLLEICAMLYKSATPKVTLLVKYFQIISKIK